MRGGEHGSLKKTQTPWERNGDTIDYILFMAILASPRCHLPLLKLASVNLELSMPIMQPVTPNFLVLFSHHEASSHHQGRNRPLCAHAAIKVQRLGVSTHQRRLTGRQSMCHVIVIPSLCIMSTVFTMI